jgi:hypothetical protein
METSSSQIRDRFGFLTSVYQQFDDYPDGSVLLCRRLVTENSVPPDGARIVVLRRRRSKVELMVRQLRSAGGEAWL